MNGREKGKKSGCGPLQEPHNLIRCPKGEQGGSRHLLLNTTPAEKESEREKELGCLVSHRDRCPSGRMQREVAQKGERRFVHTL